MGIKATNAELFGAMPFLDAISKLTYGDLPPMEKAKIRNRYANKFLPKIEEAIEGCRKLYLATEDADERAAILNLEVELDVDVFTLPQAAYAQDSVQITVPKANNEVREIQETVVAVVAALKKFVTVEEPLDW